ncbi:hypothetical protein A3841_12635 [Pontibacter flavimaris]|uniref:Outer membrane protein assembly factor BamE n=2 Tax=Pontibacter flavimaris TaxID=1797110 RepID=A0A1Q5PEQ7_9BACT|nr:hypothetical protein A3841_12635 [Pontibacter flavimaris]
MAPLTVLVFYSFWLSPEAREGNRNRRNIQQVQAGMTRNDLLRVMGPPTFVKPPMDWREGTQREGQVYLYQSPPLASDFFQFYIGADSTVRSVNYGD